MVTLRDHIHKLNIIFLLTFIVILRKRSTKYVLSIPLDIRSLFILSHTARKIICRCKHVYYPHAVKLGKLNIRTLHVMFIRRADFSYALTYNSGNIVMEIDIDKLW